MALLRLRRKENTPGDFFVDSSCIDCDLCRQIAPDTFVRLGDQSAVYRQPATYGETFSALKALVTCPTASIGTRNRHAVRKAIDAFPERIEDEVYFCGFAAESSYGASSYLIVRRGGNVLVDSPRYSKRLAERIAEHGSVKLMFLTHRDDVADHRAWARRFGAERILHADDVGGSSSDMERLLLGGDPVSLDEDLTAIPTPGHTRGHMVLLYRNRYLFSGDHLRWSESRRSLDASRAVCWYSWEEQIRSVRRLLDYRFEWVLPGHGRRVGASAEQMRRYLETCLDRITALQARDDTA